MTTVALLGVTALTNWLLAPKQINIGGKVEVNLPSSEFGSGIWDYYGIVRREGLPVFLAPEIQQHTETEGAHRVTSHPKLLHSNGFRH